MRIIVDNGTYTLDNHGDIAMLQTAIQRLRELWPDAVVEVITERPDRLRTLCPDVLPLPPSGYLFGRWHRFAPRLEAKTLRRPRVATALIKLKKAVRRQAAEHRDRGAYLKVIANADLVIGTGGGYLTDVFERHSTHLLQTLEIAADSNKLTALFGQGIGTVKSGKLADLLAAVLRKVDLITLREGRVGKDLLTALGVSSENIVLTGDDAIEMAYNLRGESLGSGIGVNMRRAWYSDVSVATIQSVKRVLQEAASRYDAALLPAPILMCRYEGDLTIIGELTATAAEDSPIASATPQDIIRQIGKCRIVVTGSYHAAVFALSQGIPAVCLAGSDYYKDKFYGLAHQFGSGCEIILVNDETLESQLKRAIDHAWESAEQVKPQLLAAAEAQIAAGRAAYRHLYNLWQEKPQRKLETELEALAVFDTQRT